jgi:arylsulfatase A-like enzyme
VRSAFELLMAIARRFGSTAAALVVSVATLTAVGAGPRPSPPNFLLILTDDQGWSQLSEAMDPELPAARSDYLETPNLTRLARQGIRFTSGYSPAPLCTPTRRSILCGTTAARSGTEFKSAWVPADHLTIPRALKRADPRYRCGHFGKWGELMISTPEQCGYDVSDGETGNDTGGMPATLGAADHTSGPPHFIDDRDPKRTPSVTREAIRFMREQVAADRPFSVQASYYATHLSVVCRQETLEKFQAKGPPDRGYSQAWAAMLAELDAGVGQLLDALEDLGVAGNTYVIFMADNGGRGTVPGGDPARPGPNHPLSGAKHSLFEGGIRVPFIVRGPGLAAGAICRQPVAGYDLLPTLYDLAGGRESLPAAIDGVSLRPLLGDPAGVTLEPPDRPLFFHRPGKRVSAVRRGSHKLILTWAADGSVASRALYELEPNPIEEGRDITADDPARADRLQSLLLAHLEAVGAEGRRP